MWLDIEIYSIPFFFMYMALAVVHYNKNLERKRKVTEKIQAAVGGQVVSFKGEFKGKFLADIKAAAKVEEDDATAVSAMPNAGDIDPSTGLPADAAFEGNKNCPPPKQPSKNEDQLYNDADGDSDDDNAEGLLTPDMQAHFQEEKKRAMELNQLMDDKTKHYFSQDLIGFTCLMFLKSNRSKFQIDMEKQSQTLYTCMMMIFFQCLLVWCLGEEMISSLASYSVPNGMKFELFLCKFIVTIAMHLNILPVLSSGFGIMKYVCNHPDNFDYYMICYTLGFIQLVFSLLFEGLNVIILFSKASVYFTLGCYFTLSILIYLQKMYYSTKIAGNRHEVLQAVYLEENTPHVTWRDHKDTWASRSFLNKLLRFNYKLFYGFYVSFIYYFIPFLFLCMMQFVNEDEIGN